MERNVVLLTIQGIALDSNAEMPVILLKPSDKKYVLPIKLGPFEANAIVLMLKNIHPPRSLTHDLFAEFMKQNGYTVSSLCIYGREQERYMAKLYYKKRRRIKELEVRPSDGIVLALHFGAPVYTYDHLLSVLPEKLDAYRDPQHLPPDSMYISMENANSHMM